MKKDRGNVNDVTVLGIVLCVQGSFEKFCAYRNFFHRMVPEVLLSAGFMFDIIFPKSTIHPHHVSFLYLFCTSMFCTCSGAREFYVKIYKISFGRFSLGVEGGKKHESSQNLTNKNSNQMLVQRQDLELHLLQQKQHYAQLFASNLRSHPKQVNIEILSGKEAKKRD